MMDRTSFDMVTLAMFLSTSSRRRYIGSVPFKYQEILLLRGAPGSGKSTVAALLAKHHEAAVIEVDDLRGELWRVPAVSGLSEPDRHHLALAQAAGMALALLRAGCRPVVVDTFNTRCVEVFQQALRGRAAMRLRALVVEPLELARRLVERPEVLGVFRDVVVSAQFNAELFAAPAWTRIDTTGIAPRLVAELVMAAAGPSTDLNG
jgi:hypothetical protein